MSSSSWYTLFKWISLCVSVVGVATIGQLTPNFLQDVINQNWPINTGDPFNWTRTGYTILIISIVGILTLVALAHVNAIGIFQSFGKGISLRSTTTENETLNIYVDDKEETLNLLAIAPKSDRITSTQPNSPDRNQIPLKSTQKKSKK